MVFHLIFFYSCKFVGWKREWKGGIGDRMGLFLSLSLFLSSLSYCLKYREGKGWDGLLEGVHFSLSHPLFLSLFVVNV